MELWIRAAVIALGTFRLAGNRATTSELLVVDDADARCGDRARIDEEGARRATRLGDPTRYGWRAR